MVQIFIAHSSKDKPLIDWIAGNLRAIGITPYQAGYDSPSETSLQDKLRREISRSQAVFLILTRNVTRSLNTSTIIQWEFDTAKEKKKPVFVFKEKEGKGSPHDSFDSRLWTLRSGKQGISHRGHEQDGQYWEATRDARGTVQGYVGEVFWSTC